MNESNESMVNKSVLNYYTSRDLFVDYYHTGSREICNPPPLDTDDDYIVLVESDKLKELEKLLIRNKWIRGGSMETELSESPYEGDKVDRTSVFSSWKKDTESTVTLSNMNLIITVSPEFYQNFKLATNLAKKLNLLNKNDRITLFEAIVYDTFPEE